MILEEERMIQRSVPSAYNTIRSMYGYRGTRQEVIAQLTLDLRADTEELRWRSSAPTTFESASPTPSA